MQTYSKELPVVATPDVLVCGTGCAGIGAAVAAARHGARTMAIDRMGFAGGFFTAIIGSGFDGFVDERTGAAVVGGIVFEMLERMGVIKPGAGPRTTFNVNGELGEIAKHPDWVVPRCDPEKFKRAADRILSDSGADAEIQGRADAWRMFELWKEALPEFEDAYFMTSGPVAGARESRRVVGDYVLTGDDIRNRRSFEDTVLLGAWRLDRHPSGQAGYHPEPVVAPYEIPFRTLVAKGFDNLLVAGRCHSATSEALASTRVTATAMAMGQAAGTATALALKSGVEPRRVKIEELRSTLRQDGAILEPPRVPGAT